MKPIIETFLTNIETSYNHDIMKAVARCGFNVSIDEERLAQAIFDARKFYAEGYEDGRKSNWTPVEEPPCVDCNVLWRDKEGVVSEGFYDGTNVHIYRLDSYEPIEHFTHWMHLPE